MGFELGSTMVGERSGKVLERIVLSESGCKKKEQITLYKVDDINYLLKYVCKPFMFSTIRENVIIREYDNNIKKTTIPKEYKYT